MHDYVELLYGDADKLGVSNLVPVALVAPGQRDCFVVQFTVAADDLSAELMRMLEEVHAALSTISSTSRRLILGSMQSTIAATSAKWY